MRVFKFACARLVLKCVVFVSMTHAAALTLIVKKGSSVLFADGTPAIAWQKKALEYGCTLDAICQLAPALEAARTLGTKPLL